MKRVVDCADSGSPSLDPLVFLCGSVVDCAIAMVCNTMGNEFSLSRNILFACLRPADCSFSSRRFFSVHSSST